MTAPRLTKRRNTLEKRKVSVLTMLAAGATNPEVAAKYKVARHSVWDFSRRHAESLQALRSEVDAGILANYTAHKGNRVAELDSLYNRSVQFLEEQGFSEKITRYNRDGEVISETERYRADTIAQLRGILDDIATEVGERVTKGDTTNIAAVVNIIRGGTPLGMAPVTEVVDATYTVEESTEAPNS